MSPVLVMILAAPASADPATAEARVTTTGLFVEGGGAGLMGSLNAHVLTPSGIWFRAGVGAVPALFGGPASTVVPVGVTYVTRTRGRALEVGCNATLWPSDGLLGVVPQVGYVYQGPRGFLFKASLTPQVVLALTEEASENRGVSNVFPWAGISVGFWLGPNEADDAVDRAPSSDP